MTLYVDSIPVVDGPQFCGFCSTGYSKIFHPMPCESEKARLWRFRNMTPEEQRRELYRAIIGGHDRGTDR